MHDRFEPMNMIEGWTGTFRKILEIGIFGWFSCDSISEIPQLRNPNFGDTPNWSQLVPICPDRSQSESQFPDDGKLGIQFWWYSQLWDQFWWYSQLGVWFWWYFRSILAIIPIPIRHFTYAPNRKPNFGNAPNWESDILTLGNWEPNFSNAPNQSQSVRIRDTLQNLGNPEFWAENFVQNPEGVHHKFGDPHFSNAVALLETGNHNLILAMH